MSDPATQPASVRLVKPDGTHVILDAQAAARVLELDKRVRVATPEETQRREAELLYGDQDVRTFVEGAASGLTFGVSDYALEGLGVSTKEELLGRREANPVASGLGEATGIIGGTLATAGLGAAGTATRGGALATKALAATPAGLAARAGMAVTEGVEAVQTARALSGAAQATSTLGRAAATALPVAAGAATEGALYGAAKQVNEDWLRDHEITAERIAMGAGLSALTGGAFALGGSVIGQLGRKAVDAVSDALPDSLPNLSQLKNERAVKAIVGQTSKKQITLAGRLGGEEMEAGIDRVGQEILDDAADAGRDFWRMSKGDLAEHARERKQFWGNELGTLETKADGILGEQGVNAIDGPALAARIESEVLEPLLSSGSSKQTGKQLRARIKDTLEELRTRPEMTVTEGRALRKGFSDHKIVWDKVKGTVVDDEAKKVYRLLEEANEIAIEKAGLADDYTKAKFRYGVNAWADKATQEVAVGDVARRLTQPSDYGVGATVGLMSSIATGGLNAGALAMGFLGSQANKLLRDRGNQFTAGILDAVSRKSAAKTAVTGEQAIVDAADGFVANLMRNARRTAAAVEESASVLGAEIVVRDSRSYERAIERISAMQNPDSPERQQIRRNYAPVTEVAPQMSQAIDAHIQKTADFLAKKAGPRSTRPDKAGAFSHLAPPKHSEAKAAKLARYARAAEDPSAAVARLKRGEVVREDVETLRELYPRLWARFSARLAAQAADVKERPSQEAQAAFQLVMGAGDFQRVQALQALAKRGAGASALQQERDQSSQQAIAPSRARPPDVAGAYATRSDRLVGGME